MDFINNQLYEKLNSAWKSFSRTVLFGEVGELRDFIPFIEHAWKRGKRSMLVNDILLFPNYYENISRIKSFNSVDFNKKFEPLNINEIKDIDTIVNAIQERIYYTGNIILGNSLLVDKSTSVFDSYYIYRSAEVYNTKYSVFSERVSGCNVVFGSVWGEDHSFVFDIKESGKLKRGFSAVGIEISQDVYYSAGVVNSKDIMFSFGIKGKRYVIGNISLPQDKYISLKKSLLEQIRSELTKNREIPLLLDIVEKASNPNFENAPVDKIVKHTESGLEINEKEKENINKSFSSVTSVLFGKIIDNVDNVKNTLNKHVPSLVKLISPLTGKELYAYDIIKNVRRRVVEFDHIFALSEYVPMHISDFQSAISEMNDKMVIPNESRQGRNLDVLDTIIPVWSQHAYRSTAPINSKYVAYSYWPQNVKHGYGVFEVLDGEYLLNVYTSKHIQRGFEIDNSRDSTDVYYCHNCEGIKEGMFSFNIHGKRNVIGNSEYSRDTYKKIKLSLTDQISDELSRDKLRYSIYNLIKT